MFKRIILTIIFLTLFVSTATAAETKSFSSFVKARFWQKSSRCVPYAAANLLYALGVELSAKKLEEFYEESRLLLKEDGFSIEKEGTLLSHFLKAVKMEQPIEYGVVEKRELKTAIKKHQGILVTLVGINFTDIAHWRKTGKRPVLYYRFGNPLKHTVVIDGWKGDLFSVVNSNGKGWGKNGRAWIPKRQLLTSFREAYWVKIN